MKMKVLGSLDEAIEKFRDIVKIEYPIYQETIEINRRSKVKTSNQFWHFSTRREKHGGKNVINALVYNPNGLEKAFRKHSYENEEDAVEEAKLRQRALAAATAGDERQMNFAFRNGKRETK